MKNVFEEQSDPLKREASLIEFHRLIDLTHTLHPGRESRKIKTTLHFVEEMNLDVSPTRGEGEWYIMHDIETISHIGTHLEAPYHFLKDGDDISKIPLNRLIGEACIIHLGHIRDSEEISLEEMKDAAKNLREDDIAVLNTGFHRFWNTKRYSKNPVPSVEALEWLIARSIKLLAVDAAGVEPTWIRRSRELNSHYLLFRRGIPLVENVANLGQLRKDRVFMICLPLKIEGLDSCPVRMIAFE